MSERTTLRLATVSALAMGTLLAAGIGPSYPDDTPGGKVTLTYVSYGGTGQDAQIKAWQQPYTAANPNVTFANTSPPDPAQVKAQVISNSVNWNIVTTAPYLASQNCGTLYEHLTIPGVDKSQLPPGVVGDCYIADFRYSLVFSYNAAKWPNAATAPKTIADFFDTKKFPGKRGVVNAVQDGILEEALLADGVKPADMYPLDVKRALQKWGTIKSDTIWAANPGALLQLITAGQVDMEILVQARSQAALDAGANVIPVWDQTVTSTDGIAIPKGSPNLAAAEAFLGFILQPQQQTMMANLSGVAPSNLQSKPNYTANGNKVNAFGPANTGTTFQVNPDWWSKNINQVASQFTQWLNG